MTAVKFLLRTVHSEWSKSRKTFIPWLCILAPVLHAALIYLTLYHAGNSIIQPGENVWDALAAQSFQGLYMIFYPLAACILVSLIFQTDHQANMWKHLYALPLPRWSIYTAKSLFAFLLIGLCLVFYSLLMPLAISLLSGRYPSWGLNNYIHAAATIFLPTALKGWIASAALCAIQSWISYRFKNFAIPLTFGLGATLVGVIAIQGWKYVGYYPYAFPLLSITKQDYILLKSVLAGSVIFALSVFDAQRFYKSKGE
jgi:hypothetical protein